MRQEKKQLRLKKFKVAKLNVHFLKGGTGPADEDPNAFPVESYDVCTSQINSNPETTCTIGLPKTNINHDCGNSGNNNCDIVSGTTNRP